METQQKLTNRTIKGKDKNKLKENKWRKEM